MLQQNVVKLQVELHVVELPPNTGTRGFKTVRLNWLYIRFCSAWKLCTNFHGYFQNRTISCFFWCLSTFEDSSLPGFHLCTTCALSDPFASPWFEKKIENTMMSWCPVGGAPNRNRVEKCIGFLFCLLRFHLVSSHFCVIINSCRQMGMDVEKLSFVSGSNH